MENNNAAWKDVMKTIEEHRTTFQQQLKNMNAQEIPPDAEAGLLDPIRTYAKYVTTPAIGPAISDLSSRKLESILGALMLENGISIRNVPHRSKFQGLATFMKRYGTVKVEAEKIRGYIDQLDAAMKQFTVRPAALDLSIHF